MYGNTCNRSRPMLRAETDVKPEQVSDETETDKEFSVDDISSTGP